MITRVSPLALLVNTVLKVLSWKIKQEIKGLEIEKKGVKLSLFADNMILLTLNPKKFTIKLFELLQFSMVAG